MKKLLKFILPPSLRPISFCKWFVKRKTGMKVFSGPFRGMNYVDQSVGSAYYPKLLGTYEKELYPVISEVINESLYQIHVIGAGEGFFAVGLGLVTGKKVNAYETSEKGRQLLVQLAKINGFGDLSVLGKCKPSELNFLDPSKKSLFFFDIEGEEIKFLYDGVFQTHKRSWFIVEIHYLEHLTRFKEVLKDQFDIDFFPVEKRDMSDFPIRLPAILQLVLKRYWISLQQEWRTSNSYGWLVLRPK